MSDLNLRLTDLFQYIEKLFTPQTSNFRYDVQNGNNLSKNSEYWVVSDLKKLENQGKDNGIIGFSLQFEDIDKPLLTIRRQEVPSFPIPENLTAWVEADFNKGNLTKREFISRMELFDDSPLRSKAFRDLSKKQESLFGEQDIPKVLTDWIVIDESSDKHDFIKIEQRNVEVRFDDDNSRIETFKKLEKEFNILLEKFQIQRSMNRLYDSLHQKYFDLKREGRQTYKSLYRFVKRQFGS